MKKNPIRLLSLLCALALMVGVLAGCGDNSAASSAAADAESAEPVSIFPLDDTETLTMFYPWSPRFVQLGQVTNTVSPVVNNGVIVALSFGTQWTVTGDCSLSASTAATTAPSPEPQTKQLS